MRPSDINLSSTLKQKLIAFNKIHPLLGISSQQRMDCFIEQIVDSIRRIKYITHIKNKNLSQVYTNPANPFFDPIKAASWYCANGNVDEAFWLTFLAIHFGKNKMTNWNLLRFIYMGNGVGQNWTWQKISNNINAFRNWLHTNQRQLKATGNFGNHRKYTSLNALGSNGTGEAIETYVNWIGQAGHQSFFQSVNSSINNSTPKILFNRLYHSMNQVAQFGRTARFDYLTMVGKLGLYNIEPDSTYMDGSTGPYSGANLLFLNNIKGNMQKKNLDQLLTNLETHLGLYFGMQVLEDALCNWQKSPDKYIHFVG